MKRALLRIPLLLSLAAGLFAGCSTSKQGQHPVYVAPWGAEHPVRTPPSQGNIVGAPPGSKLHWKQGYWVFVNLRWVWIPGHWEETRPGNGAWVWVPGRWEHQQGSWRWEPGYWRQSGLAPTGAVE